MPQPLPLELVSTPDLFNEIAKRYDHGIFYGVKIVSAPDAKEQEVIESARDWGSQLLCEGMCYQLAHDIAEDHYKSLLPVPQEEL